MLPAWLVQITEGKRQGLDAAETMAAMVTFETEQAITVALSLLPKREPWGLASSMQSLLCSLVLWLLHSQQ